MPVPVWLGVALFWGVTAWWRRERGGTALAIVTALFTALLAIPFGEIPRGTGAPDLKIVTWNIGEWTGDRESMIRALKASDADVICLQEAGFNAETWDRFEGYRWIRSGSNVVMTRLPLIDAGREKIPIEHSRRGIAWMDVMVEGRKVRISSVHLAHGFAPLWLRNPMSVPRRMKGHQQLRETQVDSILAFSRQGPVNQIVAGDFNLQPFGELERRLQSRFHDGGHNGALSGTFPAEVPWYRIDRIWARGDLQLIRSKILPGASTGHRPVMAWYRLEAR